MGQPRLREVEKQEILDLPMLVLTLLLTALGLMMIYSSSYARALYESGDSGYYFKRQLLFAMLGTGAMLAVSRVRPQLIRKLAFPVLGVSVVFLVLVFVPGIGRSENGATRWVSMGISFQPSEVAKLGIILSFAGVDFCLRRENGDVPLGHCTLRGDSCGNCGAAAAGTA